MNNRWGALPLGELTPDDELELRALVGRAFDARYKPLFGLRCEDIVDWYDQRFQRAYARRQRSTAAVLQTLRETNPREVAK